MNECLTDEVLQNQSPFTYANLRVTVVDEDIDPLNFDQETQLNKENIKIKEHQEFYHGCPCIENRDNVVKFDGNVQKCTNDIKVDGEAQKIKDSNNELKKRKESGDSCSTSKRKTQIEENITTKMTLHPPPPEDDENKEKRTDDISSWDSDFLKVDQGTLFELILAANYLDIKGLLDVTCKTVANMIKGKTPEEIRKTFNIKNDFTPAEEEQIRKENEWCEEK